MAIVGCCGIEKEKRYRYFDIFHCLKIRNLNVYTPVLTNMLLYCGLYMAFVKRFGRLSDD